MSSRCAGSGAAAACPPGKPSPGRPLRAPGWAGGNRTSAWLARLTRGNGLPQKLFVIHQFRLDMIGHPERLRTDHPELALLIHMDGQGTPAQKHATWRAVHAARPAGVPLGWMNFYDEDNPTFTPARTMAKRPRPVMVFYQ